MSEDIREKLSSEMDTAVWEWLKPHQERGVVIVVSVELNLLEVGIAVAKDEREKVQEWMASQDLTKPTLAQIETWNRDPSKPFQVLILQPYVLIQECAH